MTNSWKIAVVVLSLAAGGCATSTAETNLAQGACSDPIPDGAVITTCTTGVSAATRQTVASDRCIGAVAPRESRQGSINRSTLC